MKEASFSTQPGDLVFQQRARGDAGLAISRVFKGVNDWHVNHVALCVGDDLLVEAVEPCVQQIALPDFVQQAEVPQDTKPTTFVCRLNVQYQHLIADAVSFTLTQQGLPYNHDFSVGGNSWYCSELVLEAFREANQGDYLFLPTPMSFHDTETGRIIPWWLDYFEALGKPVPEGAPGSHPALLSRSEYLKVVHCF